MVGDTQKMSHFSHPIGRVESIETLASVESSDSLHDADSWFDQTPSATMIITKPEDETDQTDNHHQHQHSRQIDMSGELIKEEDSDSDDNTGCFLDNDDENDSDDGTQIIFVENILLKDPLTMKANEVIQDQCTIGYFTQVLFEGSPFNKTKQNRDSECGHLYSTSNSTSYSPSHTMSQSTPSTVDPCKELTIEKLTDIISYLSWISLSAGILADRIQQEHMHFVLDENYPRIVRSSYNFCVKYTQCKNYYTKKEKPTCNEHHFVHSILKYDVDSVIAFLRHIVGKNRLLSWDERESVYSSIKTVCFVTRHMAKEIGYIDYLTKKNSEDYHRSNPIDVTKRRNPPNRKNWNQHNYSNNSQHQQHRPMAVKCIDDCQHDDTHPSSFTHYESNRRTSTQSTHTPNPNRQPSQYQKRAFSNQTNKSNNFTSSFRSTPVLNLGSISTTSTIKSVESHQTVQSSSSTKSDYVRNRFAGLDF